jgi:signal transduction histidine kinase
MATETALSTLSRYEALFELTSDVNASTEIAQVGKLLAQRLKYFADVFSWRYFSLEPDESHSTGQRVAIVVDGFRGQATVDQIPEDQLCRVELELWRGKKSRILEGAELESAKQVLPEQFRKDTILQVYVCPHFGTGSLRSMLLYSKVRNPFNDLDIKFLNLASGIFHDKVHQLWEQQKLRDLELAYLQQEITLRQSEKLATLGRLSAGMAHELNNPAAAAQRAAQQLREEIERYAQAQRSLGESNLSEKQAGILASLATLITDRIQAPADVDAMTQSDLEYEIETWLEARGVAEPWRFSPTLVTIGFTEEKLGEIARELGDERLATVLVSITCGYMTQSLMAEIREGAGRIADIVNALKSYTHLDQAPVQTIDVHEGLNDTLVMLRGKLKGVTVRREFDTALPQIQGFGSELNQVWTNVVDNAVAAMQGEGTLTLKSFMRDPWIVVQIIDDGPGIPADIQPKVFDPFFTTKPPGSGTGLGLNISHSIVVQKHKGEMEVRSKPGETCFEMRLPKLLDLEVAEPGSASD